MGVAIEELQRIGLKVFAADGASVRPREFVPVFHRWIQTQAVGDHLLIDVADYEHVPEGPGVLLAAHEGNFSVDLGDSRMGLAYNRKTPLPGALTDRLRAVAHSALAACRLLEDDSALGGRVHFRGDQLYLFANDRLHAPNTAETLTAFQPALQAFLRTVYGDAPCVVAAEADARQRFGLRVTASRPLSVRELLQRLG
jgi:hypothetical protein